MIAVQVLSQTVSNNAINADSAENEVIEKSSPETGDVVSLLQEQISAGTQMYSLQISGQTIPFTTIQLPMLQQTQQEHPVTSSSNAPVLQQLTEDISASISNLGVSTNQLQLTFTPDKDRAPYPDGEERFLCHETELIHSFCAIKFTLLYSFVCSFSIISVITLITKRIHIIATSYHIYVFLLMSSEI